MINQAGQEQINILLKEFCSYCEFCKIQITYHLNNAQKTVKKIEQQIKGFIKQKKESLKGQHPEQFTNIEKKLQKKQQKYSKFLKIIELFQFFLDAFTDAQQGFQVLFDNIHQTQIQFNQLVQKFEVIINCVQNFQQQEDLRPIAYYFIHKCMNIDPYFKNAIDIAAGFQVILEVNEFEKLEQKLKQLKETICQKKREYKKNKKEKIQELQDFQFKRLNERKYQKRKNKQENESNSSQSLNDDQIDGSSVSDGNWNYKEEEINILNDDQLNEIANQNKVESVNESIILLKFNSQDIRIPEQQEQQKQSVSFQELNEKLDKIELDNQQKKQLKIEQVKILENALHRMKQQFKKKTNKIAIWRDLEDMEQYHEFSALMQFQYKRNLNKIQDYKKFTEQEDKYQKKQQRKAKEQERWNQKYLAAQHKQKIQFNSNNLYKQQFDNVREKITMDNLSNTKYDDSRNNAKGLSEDIENFQQAIQNLQEPKQKSIKQIEKTRASLKGQKEKEELIYLIIDYIYVQSETLQKEALQGIDFEKIFETIVEKVQNDELVCCNCFGMQSLYIQSCSQRIFCLNCLNCGQISDKLSQKFQILD